MDTIKPLHFFGFALGPSNATGDVSGPGYDLRKVMKERLDHLLAVEQY